MAGKTILLSAPAPAAGTREFLTLRVVHAADNQCDPVRPAAAPQVIAHGEDIQPDRVWTLKELDILHNMAKPIAVVVHGMYEDPHRYCVLLTTCTAANCR